MGLFRWFEAAVGLQQAVVVAAAGGTKQFHSGELILAAIDIHIAAAAAAAAVVEYIPQTLHR